MCEHDEQDMVLIISGGIYQTMGWKNVLEHGPFLFQKPRVNKLYTRLS